MAICKSTLLIVVCTFVLVVQSKILRLPSKENEHKEEEKSKNFKIYPNHRKEGKMALTLHLHKHKQELHKQLVDVYFP
jgi:hypothetical protein